MGDKEHTIKYLVYCAPISQDSTDDKCLPRLFQSLPEVRQSSVC